MSGIIGQNTGRGTGLIKTPEAGGDNKPAFQAYANSSGQDIGSGGTWTKINMDTEVFDTNGEYDHSSNYRFTPQTAGKYFVYASVTFATHASGENSGAADIQHIRASIYKNGSISAGTLDWDYGNNYFFQGTKLICAIIDMNGSSDYVEAYGRNANANNNTNAIIQIGADETFFGAYKIIT